MKEVAEHLLPELKESEGERIRKALHSFIKGQKTLSCFFGISKDQMLSWLEKQREQKSELLTKEKALNNSPFVEPKFKVGDWVVSDDKDVHDDYRVCKITKIVDGRYYIEGGDFLSESTLEQYEYRLWTIQDAKEGDVLELDCGIGIFKDKCIDGYNIHCYCYYSNEGVLEINKDSLYDTYQSHPATKEQCDALMKAMSDAGYTFDFEKKELKKIEQKPAWSEEDEKQARQIERIVHNDGCTQKLQKQISDWFKSLKDRVQPKQEWSEEDRKIIIELIGIFESAVDGGHVSFPYRLIKDYIRVLKSCLPQTTWKPSEEMLEALYRVIPENVMEKSENEMLLDKLYQGLKYGRVLSEK